MPIKKLTDIMRHAISKFLTFTEGKPTPDIAGCVVAFMIFNGPNSASNCNGIIASSHLSPTSKGTKTGAVTDIPKNNGNDSIEIR